MHPSGVAKSSTSFVWGKGGNVTSAGWQVTLCDPIWYVSSRSGDGRPACKLLYAHFTLLYFTLLAKSVNNNISVTERVKTRTVTVNYSDFAIFLTPIILFTLLIDDCGKIYNKYKYNSYFYCAP